MRFGEVETGLKVGEHPGGNTGTAFRMILTTSEPYPGAYVGEALEWYARVFAAAPDLLEACKAMLDTIDSMTETDLTNPLFIALGAQSVPYRLSLAAIAKATKGE